MPRITYEAIQKQIAKLQAQAAKIESAQGVAEMDRFSETAFWER